MVWVMKGHEAGMVHSKAYKMHVRLSENEPVSYKVKVQL